MRKPHPLPHEKDSCVLVAGDDHNFVPHYVSETKVTYNPTYGVYFEYHGDEYLDEGEIVVTARVAG